MHDRLLRRPDVRHRRFHRGFIIELHHDLDDLDVLQLVEFHDAARSVDQHDDRAALDQRRFNRDDGCDGSNAGYDDLVEHHEHIRPDDELDDPRGVLDNSDAAGV